MPDKTLGAYQRHEPLTADDFANADFARHADGRIARRANPDLWVYNQPPSSAPAWSVCRDMAEDGGWSPVRGCPDPDVHLDRDAGDAAVRWMIRTKEREARAQQAEKERDDARALLAEAQEEATRQAARAEAEAVMSEARERVGITVQEESVLMTSREETISDRLSDAGYTEYAEDEDGGVTWVSAPLGEVLRIVSAAQEPTEAEVDAVAGVLAESEDTGSVETARAALRAARAARRDEEKRDG